VRSFIFPFFCVYTCRAVNFQPKEVHITNKTTPFISIRRDPETLIIASDPLGDNVILLVAAKPLKSSRVIDAPILVDAKEGRVSVQAAEVSTKYLLLATRGVLPVIGNQTSGTGGGDLAISYSFSKLSVST
jgi:hypothetical protein